MPPRRSLADIGIEVRKAAPALANPAARLDRQPCGEYGRAPPAPGNALGHSGDFYGAPQVDRGRWRSCAANAKCAGNFIAKLRAPPMLHEAQVARQDVFVHISAVERSALTFARRQGQPPRCLVPQSWAGRSHCSNTSAM